MWSSVGRISTVLGCRTGEVGGAGVSGSWTVEAWPIEVGLGELEEVAHRPLKKTRRKRAPFSPSFSLSPLSLGEEFGRGRLLWRVGLGRELHEGKRWDVRREEAARGRYSFLTRVGRAWSRSLPFVVHMGS